MGHHSTFEAASEIQGHVSQALPMRLEGAPAHREGLVGGWSRPAGHPWLGYGRRKE